MENNTNLDLLKKDRVYKTDCVRKRSNFSITDNMLNLIDNKEGISQNNHKLFNDIIQTISPKLTYLLQNIENLDNKDMKKYGKKFKHFIFTDVRSSQYGAKRIGSGFINKGYQLSYDAIRKEKETKEGDIIITFNKIVEKTDEELQKTKYNNFTILCTSPIYDQSISVTLKKNILQRFNSRPDNIYGENIRFIIMDSGYKEGIDLFDIKYIHMLEPQTTMADLKQVIGRGTRLCGQKGLPFDTKRGWELDVYVYDLNISKNIQPLFLNANTTFELYLKTMNNDISLLNFYNHLQEIVIESSIDYELNKNINHYTTQEDREIEYDKEVMEGGNKKELSILQNRLTYHQLQEFINSYFKRYKWDKIKVENLCIDKEQEKEEKEEKEEKTRTAKLIDYTNTQDFIRHYFTPDIYQRGILLWHSVGTGKTCTAIATASTTFEEQGYTILWVTRTTLINDIWKNMFHQVCNENIKKMILENDEGIIPTDLNRQKKLLGKSWKIKPLSYRQFTNLINKKNIYYQQLVKINGEEDPLRKTLIIIDEAHKLYGESDLLTNEKPDMNKLHESLMNSYAISGKESAKLMLMSATPITKDPMELIKLINLCKPLTEQLPNHYNLFKQEFLDNDGLFLSETKNIFQNEIAGYISYLDRSSDIRQFAQPKIHNIHLNLITDKNVLQEDPAGVKKINTILKQQLRKNKKTIREKKDNATIQLKKIRKTFKKQSLEKYQNKIHHLTNKKIQTKCKKLINDEIKHINQKLINDGKEIMETFKKNTDEINDKLKLDIFQEDMSSSSTMVTDFEKSIYYNIKNRCKYLKDTDEVNTYLENVPEIEEINNDIITQQELIKTNKKTLQEQLKIYKQTKKNNPPLKDEINKEIQEIKDKTNKEITNIKEHIKHLNKTKKNALKNLKEELKLQTKENIKKEKEMLKIQKKNMDIETVKFDDTFNKLVNDNQTLLESNIDKIYKQCKEDDDNLLKTNQKKTKKKNQNTQQPKKTKTIKKVICKEGKELNKNTNRCVNKCKEGFIRNQDFKCIKSK